MRSVDNRPALFLPGALCAREYFGDSAISDLVTAFKCAERTGNGHSMAEQTIAHRLVARKLFIPMRCDMLR